MRGVSPEIKKAHLNSQFLARTGALWLATLFKKDTPASHIFKAILFLPGKHNRRGCYGWCYEGSWRSHDGVMKVLWLILGVMKVL